MTLGKRLEAIRENRGITRQHLAELVGKTESAVWRWEREDRAISADTLEKVAEALNVPITLFFCGTIVDGRDNKLSTYELDILQIPVVRDLSAYIEKGEVDIVMPLPTTLFKDITPRSFVYVVGVSSKPDVVPDHAHVIVNPDRDPVTGSLVLASVHGAVALRYATKKKDGLYLDGEPASDEIFPVGVVSKILYDPIVRL